MKIGFLWLILLTLTSATVKAQVANSKWKGVLKLDNPLNVTFTFGRDTLTVFNLDDNSVLETMTYSATGSNLTINKISGQSDCDNATTGKYKIEIKENTLIMTTIEDACEDRAVLNNMQLVKQP